MKRHLISSHLPLEMAISQSEHGSLDDKEPLVSAAASPPLSTTVSPSPPFLDMQTANWLVVFAVFQTGGWYFSAHLLKMS